MRDEWVYPGRLFPRIGTDTRRLRPFELKSDFYYSWGGYDAYAAVRGWAAWVYPRKFIIDASGVRRFETILRDDKAFLIYDQFGEPDQSAPYGQGRYRDKFPAPNDRGSYGLAEFCEITNRWSLVWLEPEASVIRGEVSWGASGYVLGPPIAICHPARSIVCDQDPAAGVIVNFAQPHLPLPSASFEIDPTGRTGLAIRTDYRPLGPAGRAQWEIVSFFGSA